jgi:HSP20 family protein
MAWMRRDVESVWPQGWDRGLFDRPFRPFEAWRRLLGEGEVSVEEFMEHGEIVVRAELPGVDSDRDVDIEIVDGNLRIRAERRQEEKVEERNYRRSEIRYGSFTRILPLPSGTKEDDIKASYKDGILEVRAPVQERVAKASKIPISHT